MKRKSEHLAGESILENITPIKPADISTEKNRTGAWRYLTPYHEKRPAPCEAACPLSVPIPDFINELEKGSENAAGLLIRLENPLPEICGRVCNRQCEDNCSRGSFDMPVAVRSLERFAGDRSSGERMTGRFLPGNSGHSTGVVGGGPAGISASYFLLLLGYRVTIYEKEKGLGGVLRNGIPEYRLPAGVLYEALKPLSSLEPEIITGSAFGSTLSINDLKKKSALFFATGAPVSESVDKIKGGKSIIPGLILLGEIKSGERSLAGKRVAVMGGGNTAVDTARSLLRTGCRPVIVYRRGLEDMKAFKNDVREAVSEGVKIITGSIIREVVSSGGIVSGVKCVKVKGEAGYRGELSEISGSDFSMDVDAVVSAIGENPELSLYRDILEETSGKVKVDRFNRTPVKGIYSGGDLADSPHLVVNALAAGKMAAVAIDADLNGMNMEGIYEYIKTGEKGISFRKYLEIREKFINSTDPGERAPDPVSKDEINTGYFIKKARRDEKKLPFNQRRASFEEVQIGFDEEAAADEASRCFQCGRCTLCKNCILFCPDMSTSVSSDNTGIDIDYDYCKGCGICAQECPGAFIAMKRDEV
jgi:2-oxoacid:acceptor oxidoreductase delta subunit (pyruvate/2-ketoisovalerate family)